MPVAQGQGHHGVSSSLRRETMASLSEVLLQPRLTGNFLDPQTLVSNFASC